MTDQHANHKKRKQHIDEEGKETHLPGSLVVTSEPPTDEPMVNTDLAHEKDKAKLPITQQRILRVYLDGFTLVSDVTAPAKTEIPLLHDTTDDNLIVTEKNSTVQPRFILRPVKTSPAVGDSVVTGNGSAYGHGTCIQSDSYRGTCLVSEPVSEATFVRELSHQNPDFRADLATRGKVARVQYPSFSMFDGHRLNPTLSLMDHTLTKQVSIMESGHQVSWQPHLGLFLKPQADKAAPTVLDLELAAHIHSSLKGVKLDQVVLCPNQSNPIRGSDRQHASLASYSAAVHIKDYQDEAAEPVAHQLQSWPVPLQNLEQGVVSTTLQRQTDVPYHYSLVCQVTHDKWVKADTVLSFKTVTELPACKCTILDTAHSTIFGRGVSVAQTMPNSEVRVPVPAGMSVQVRSVLTKEPVSDQESDTESKISSARVVQRDESSVKIQVMRKIKTKYTITCTIKANIAGPVPLHIRIPKTGTVEPSDEYRVTKDYVEFTTTVKDEKTVQVFTVVSTHERLSGNVSMPNWLE